MFSYVLRLRLQKFCNNKQKSNRVKKSRWLNRTLLERFYILLQRFSKKDQGSTKTLLWPLLCSHLVSIANNWIFKNNTRLKFKKSWGDRQKICKTETHYMSNCHSLDGFIQHRYLKISSVPYFLFTQWGFRGHFILRICEYVSPLNRVCFSARMCVSYLQAEHVCKTRWVWV